jgi:hypothetical protein
MKFATQIPMKNMATKKKLNVKPSLTKAQNK